MSKTQNPFQREDWIEEMIKQAPEFKEFQKQSFKNFKVLQKLENQKYQVENSETSETKTGVAGFFQIFTTHALTASLTAMLCLGGIGTFAAEKTLPIEFKPSTLVNKINPFAENLKGGRGWLGNISSITVSVSSSALSSSSVLSSSSLSSSQSSATSSSKSSNNSSQNSSTKSSSSAVISSSTSTASSSIITISASSSSVSSKAADSFESVKPIDSNPKVENIKLKFGESGPDKSVFSMKDASGSIYYFNGVDALTTDLIDITKPDQEYYFTGNLSETIIDRTKYPVIKWKIFNAKDSARFEAVK